LVWCLAMQGPLAWWGVSLFATEPRTERSGKPILRSYGTCHVAFARHVFGHEEPGGVERKFLSPRELDFSPPRLQTAIVRSPARDPSATLAGQEESETFKASGARFFRRPPGHVQDWHNASHRQYALTLSIDELAATPVCDEAAFLIWSGPVKALGP
jgi:hypothetical protein